MVADLVQSLKTNCFIILPFGSCFCFCLASPVHKPNRFVRGLSGHPNTTTTHRSSWLMCMAMILLASLLPVCDNAGRMKELASLG